MRQHIEEEHPQARDYRLRRARRFVLFLQSRMLLQPLEERLGTDSDYRIEKAVLGSTGTTKRVKKIRSLEIRAGEKFLCPAELLVEGVTARYQHPAFELLREDVCWTLGKVWEKLFKLPRNVVEAMFVCAGGVPLTPPVRQPQSARQLRELAQRARPLDQLAIWLGVFRERDLIGDAAAAQLLHRQVPALLAAFRAEFGEGMAFVLSQALNHGPTARNSPPIYKPLYEHGGTLYLGRNRP